MELGGKTAIVTGSGRGIGRALALEFSRQGANVVCCARSKEEIRETVALLEKEGGHGIAVPTDVTRKEQVEKMVKEAEKFASEDKKRKEEAELRNQADTVVYSTEKSLKEYGDKVSPEEREKIEKTLKAAKEALAGSDLEKIKKTQEELSRASHKLAEEVYKEAAKKREAKPGEEKETKKEEKKEEKKKEKEDVIEAEYEEKDEGEEKKD